MRDEDVDNLSYLLELVERHNHQTGKICVSIKDGQEVETLIEMEKRNPVGVAKMVFAFAETMGLDGDMLRLYWKIGAGMNPNHIELDLGTIKKMMEGRDENGQS